MNTFEIYSQITKILDDNEIEQTPSFTYELVKMLELHKNNQSVREEEANYLFLTRG